MDDIVKEERPVIIGGLTVKVRTGCGNMYCQLNWCHGRLFEVFATLGKSGGCASCHTEAVTRMVTAALRSHMPIDECIDNLRGLRCPSPVPFPKEDAAMSCPDAIANTIVRYGKLTVHQVIDLILEANDLKEPEQPLDKDAEREQAMKNIEELKRKREEDGV